MGRALALQAAGQRAEAELMMRQSLAKNETTLGPDDLNVASDLNHLASLLYVEKRFDEAEPLIRRVVTIVGTKLGEGHEDTVTPRENLSALLAARSKREQE
jgi:hypothetical protein